MCVPVAVWQPCQLLYTCYLLTYFTATTLTHRYQLVKINKNWNEAQLYCESQYNAKLVVINDQREQLALQEYLDTLDGQLLYCLLSQSNNCRGIDIKKRFLTFFNLFLFFKRFYFKNVGKAQSGKQINKKHFQNNNNEIDL